jgi:predicted ABC-type ATPase
MQATPTLWIIAGPNGVGKTTYAFRHIRAVAGTTRFVNLDEIARGLSPLEPEAGQRRAARVALELVHALIDEGRSFSMETTLSGRTHLRTIERAREAGFAATLLFFAVRSPEICLARIARRVSEGGHDVPEADVRRRFGRAVGNLRDYIEAVDLWRVFDNNGGRPEAVGEGRQGCVTMLRATDGLPPSVAEALGRLPPCPEA